MTAQGKHPTHEPILTTVGFADLNGAALDLDRLHRGLINGSLSLLETSMAVDELVTAGRLVRRDDLVALAGGQHEIDQASAGAQRAADSWSLATTWASTIGRLPFVRMVAVVGRLAIGVMGPNDVIELFIIVRPRRLWMTRRMITRVVRTASADGLNLEPVYLSTTRAPELEPHSLAVAWELAHMVVIVGEEVSRTLKRSNAWMFDLLPNATVDGNLDHHIAQSPSRSQRWTESVLLLPPFRFVESWTRRRQIAELRKELQADGATVDRFSIEVCDAHFGERAARRDRAWTNR